MSACLPMYDLPEVRAHTDRLWCALAAHLRAAGVTELPEALERGHGVDALLAPDLLLGQTCGYPLTHALAGRVRYLATPCYTARGCAGGFYRSAFVVRTGDGARHLADTRGGVFAFNGRDSQSGWNAPRLALARVAGGQPMFRALLESGAHARSLAAVAAGDADLCAVDGVTLALLQHHRRGALDDLRVLAWTEPAPGLPWVTRAGADDRLLRTLRGALAAVLADRRLRESTRALLLDGIEVLPVACYERLVDMEREAARLGYPDIV